MTCYTIRALLFNKTVVHAREIWCENIHTEHGDEDCRERLCAERRYVDKNLYRTDA